MVHLTLCLALQALADSNTPTVQLRGPSQDSELGMTGGVPPAERVFMYLQVHQSSPLCRILQDISLYPTGCSTSCTL